MDIGSWLDHLVFKMATVFVNIDGVAPKLKFPRRAKIGTE